MRHERLGFALCGSFCTHKEVLGVLAELCREYETVLPIVSQACQTTDTRFGTAEAFLAEVERLTGHTAIGTIRDAEPIGPKKLLDALVIAPAPATTVSIVAACYRNPGVQLGQMSLLRNERRLVVAVATNDGLSAAARNIGELLVRKNIFFVPFGQDDPEKKPCSLMADFTRIGETVDAALEGRQLQPVLRR